jgi:hypothetical protein
MAIPTSVRKVSATYRQTLIMSRPQVGSVQSALQTPPVPSAEKLLDSWKEIAKYLGREVRTVQRWEKREQLPIRRHRHQRMASVYALPSELDAWRNTRLLTSTARAEKEAAPLGLVRMEPGRNSRRPEQRGKSVTVSVRWEWSAGHGAVAVINYDSPSHFKPAMLHLTRI